MMRFRIRHSRLILLPLVLVLLTAPMMSTTTLAQTSERAYVTNSASSSVSVIDRATNIVVATVPVEGGALGAAVTPDGVSAHATNLIGTTVSVIDTATNTVVATVPVGFGSSPLGVAIPPDGASAYVANNGHGNVSVIDTATNTIVATVTVGVFPYGVALTPF